MKRYIKASSEIELNAENLMAMFQNSKTSVEYETMYDADDNTPIDVTVDVNRVHDALFPISMKITDRHLDELINLTKGCDNGWTTPRYDSMYLGNGSYRAITIYKPTSDTHWKVSKYIKQNATSIGQYKEKGNTYMFYDSGTEIIVIEDVDYGYRDSKIAYLDRKTIENLMRG